MRILANVPEYNRRNTTRILQFLTFSQRPLRIEELVDAIAVDLEHEPSFDIRSRMPVPMEILRCCSSLVVFSEETGEIRLSHFSVKEFITSKEHKGIFTQSLEKFTANESIIGIITAYMLSLKDTDVKHYKLKETYHLADYCAEHWVDHARIVEENSPNFRQRLLELFSNKESWFFCNKIYNLGGPYDNWTCKVGWPESIVEPLYIASSSGLKYLVKDLLLRGADINADGGKFGTALRVACQEGHPDIARILIESGADMDIACGWHPSTALVTAIDNDLFDLACLQIHHGANLGIRGYLFEHAGDNLVESYPLHLACIKGAREVIKALTSKKADVNVIDEKYGAALKILSMRGYKDLVKLLLDNGADIDQKSSAGESNDTALDAACFSGHYEVVKLLLQRGADTRVQNRNGETPLHTAARADHKDIARLLLAHGADVNAQFDEVFSPLHLAAWLNHERMVQLLLEHGADVHAQFEEIGTALHIAAWNDHKVIAQLLLEKGANPHVEGQNSETPFKIANRRDRLIPDSQQREMIFIAGPSRSILAKPAPHKT